MELMLEEAQHFDAPVGIQHENGKAGALLEDLLEHDGLLYPNRIKHALDGGTFRTKLLRSIEAKYDELNGHLDTSSEDEAMDDLASYGAPWISLSGFQGNDIEALLQSDTHPLDQEAEQFLPAA